MSAIGGPNIVENDLVLSLDIANNNSFKGEPTENLRLTNVNGGYDRFNYASGQWTYNGIQTTGEFVGWEKITATRTSTGNRLIMGLNGITALANTQYTASIEFVAPFNNLTFNLTGNQGIGDANRINNTNKYFRTFTKNNTTGGQHWYLASTQGNANFDITNGVIYYRRIQWEQKPYPTPWVNGIRGTTVSTGGGWGDLTGNENHGELINGPTFDNSNLGSLEFDGVDDVVVIPSTNLNNCDYSVEAWFNCNTINRTNGIIGDLQFDWWTLMVQSNNTIRCRHKQSDQLGGPILVSNTTVQANTWYMVTMTFNTIDGMKLYVNGQLDNSTNNNQPFTITNRGPQYIGQHRGSGPTSPNVMDGKISNVKIYKFKTLTPEEIFKNFNSKKSRFNL